MSDHIAGNLRHLAYLLTAYFHRDYFYDGDDADGVLDSFSAQEPAKVVPVAQDAARLLAEGLDEDAVARALIRLGIEYDPRPDGLSYIEFLSKIAARAATATPGAPSADVPGAVSANEAPYVALGLLLGLYFSTSGKAEVSANGTEELLSLFVQESPEWEVRDARDDARRMLEQVQGESRLAEALLLLGLEHDVAQEGLTHRQWLERVAALRSDA